MMRTEGHGAVVVSPITQQKSKYLGFSFVDDTDNCTTGANPATAVHKMQALLDAWASGVGVTGGLLVPEKSHWYLVSFVPDSNGDYHPYVPQPNECSLTLPDASGNPCPIELLSPKDARRTLGVEYAPTGTMSSQKAVLRAKSEQWANRIRQCGLPRPLVWLAFHTTILKSLEFPLATTTLTEDECTWILRPALSAALSCSGINRNVANAIVYGPSCLQGLNVPHLYDTQAISRFARLLKHSDHQQDTTWQLLQTSLEFFQLDLGLPGDPLQAPPEATYTTPSWIQDVQAHSTRVGWSIQRPFSPFQPIWSNDVFLMQLFLTYTIDPIDLRTLNKCRLFLRALTVGDLLDASGTVIRHNAFHEPKPIDHHDYDWPPQVCPPSSAWSLWRQTLKQCLHLSPTGTTTLTLGILRRWPQDWWYSFEDQALFTRDSHSYSRFESTSTRRRRHTHLTFSTASTPSLLPSDAKPVAVRLSHLGWQIDGLPGTRPTPPPLPPPHHRSTLAH